MAFTWIATAISGLLTVRVTRRQRLDAAPPPPRTGRRLLGVELPRPARGAEDAGQQPTAAQLQGGVVRLLPMERPLPRAVDAGRVPVAAAVQARRPQRLPM